MKSDFRSKSFKRNSVEFFFCLQLSEKSDEKLVMDWHHIQRGALILLALMHSFTFLLNYMIFKNF